ncbi:hypothetical protein QBC36DRAFT_307542 [Triangularia setosa]|uniref:Uncharacterized protein n=1 Tax=Triangularia setosa TaxID=2587417 RepID=A0AAN7ABL3_9PEZI|nr:hypothetical protein QBC36DRAFT_307542 [Podospora setosa]
MMLHDDTLPQNPATNGPFSHRQASTKYKHTPKRVSPAREPTPFSSTPTPPSSEIQYRAAPNLFELDLRPLHPRLKRGTCVGSSDIQKPGARWWGLTERVLSVPGAAWRCCRGMTFWTLSDLVACVATRPVSCAKDAAGSGWPHELKVSISLTGHSELVVSLEPFCSAALQNTLQTDVPDMTPASSDVETDTRDHTSTWDSRGLFDAGLSRRGAFALDGKENKPEAGVNERPIVVVCNPSSQCGCRLEKTRHCCDMPGTNDDEITARCHARARAVLTLFDPKFAGLAPESLPYLLSGHKNRTFCLIGQQMPAAVAAVLEFPDIHYNAISSVNWTIRSSINQEAYRPKESALRVSSSQYAVLRTAYNYTGVTAGHEGENPLFSTTEHHLWMIRQKMHLVGTEQRTLLPKSGTASWQRRLLVCSVLHGFLASFLFTEHGGCCCPFGVKKAIEPGNFDEAPRGCRPTTTLKPERRSVPAKRGTVRNAEQKRPLNLNVKQREESGVPLISTLPPPTPTYSHTNGRPD